MTWDDEITLIKDIVTTNEWAEEVIEKEMTEVWANVYDIRQSEFYAAIQNELKLSKMFVVHPYEYDNQTQLIYDGSTYTVRRTYRKNHEELELICEVTAGER